MRRVLLAVVLSCVAGIALQGQGPAAFDVASVKVNRSGEAPMRITAPPGRFDVAGRTAESLSRDQVLAMVRTLLADRFQLRAHQEMREMPTYALVASADRRRGPALRVSALDCSTPETRSKCSTRITPRSITGTGMTMARLALTLSAVVGRVVADETGIDGGFDFELTFAPEGPLPPSATSQPQDADAPGIFTALREQLGLRLDGRRRPVEVLMVDRVQRPTPD